MAHWRTLLHPGHLAAIVTWLAVALALRAETAAAQPLLWALMLAFLLAMLGVDALPERRRAHAQVLSLLLQSACALALVWLAPRGGTAPVLVVVVVAQLAMHYPPRQLVAPLLALNLGVYLVLRASGHPAPLVVTLLYAGFQAFAALTAHYARTAEESRDALARVNADLLATRALLAESARDAERLRVARELHDVAGHKLTALTLNLRALAAEPTVAAREELAVARALSEELLADIRSIVQAMRDARGLDLGTALRALAAPLPRPRLQLDIDDTLQVEDAATAEAVLRLVQEALTNSARHAGARELRVSLRRNGDRLDIEAEDDGRLRGPLQEGNGLAGMRERIAALGGELQVGRGARGALRIAASLPL